MDNKKITVNFRNRDTESNKKFKRRIASNYIRNPLIREYVFNRDSYKCVLCGSKEFLQVDHIISVYRGGENTLGNLQTLCRSCNAGKRV